MTSWIAAHQASLSITNSRSLHRLMSIELVMPSNHLILCLLLLLPSIFPSIRVFSNESALSVTLWQIDGETVETVRDFILGGSKITADDDYSLEIKRHLILGRKVMTNLDRVLKSRDISLLTKVHLVKAMFFPVVIYGCESWTIKKAEHRRIDDLELWCWRRLLRGPWTPTSPS